MLFDLQKRVPVIVYLFFYIPFSGATAIPLDGGKGPGGKGQSGGRGGAGGEAAGEGQGDDRGESGVGRGERAPEANPAAVAGEKIAPPLFFLELVFLLSLHFFTDPPRFTELTQKNYEIGNSRRMKRGVVGVGVGILVDISVSHVGQSRIISQKTFPTNRS